MKVFNELRKLYIEKEQDNLVVFVGAGISENYAEVEGDKGFPSWNKLIEQLLLEDLTKSDLDFLKIAQIYQDNHSKEALVHKVKELFPDDYNCHEIHKLIFDLEPTHILTTNYDSLLEKAMRFKNLDSKYHIVDTDDLIPLSKSKQNLLVKAHGDLCRGNIVLSEQDYNDYEKNFPLILSFIRFVFSKYKVLFIGFSLSDPNFNKILYWVKNILEENTIKHTVILHNDISESERVHFQKKSVNVITREEIVNEIIKEDGDEDNYLLASLNFIKNGFPNQKYSIEQRLDVLKANLQSLKYFEYLLPEMINAFLENTYLSFSYTNSPEVENKTQADKKDVRYPWICNIYQTDSFLDGKPKFNLLYKLKNELNDMEVIREFTTNYFKDLGVLLIKNNIATVGYVDSMTDERNIVDLLNESDNKTINYLLTYKYVKKDDVLSLEETDNSFEQKSPFCKQLVFDRELFFSDYLTGDKATAYKKCKSEKYRDDIEKYFLHFRLHFLWTGRKISDYVEIDRDTLNMYDYIFDNMDKHNQKIFSSIHRLGFIQNYFNFITDLENDFFVLLNSNITEWRSGFDRKTLYWISFYINYSRFLKFVILNKLPIVEDSVFQKSIHKSNMLYFNNFMKSFNENEKIVDIPNWILIGFLMDNDVNDIRRVVIDAHIKHLNKPYSLTFDKSYFHDLLTENMDVLVNDGHLHFSNILYILSLSTSIEDNFIFFLDMFHTIISSNIKNIEYFSEQLHIAYINYSKHNTFNAIIKDKLLSILDLYIEHKLDYKEDEKSIDDTKFANFLFDIDLNFSKKSKKILDMLNSSSSDISCLNLSSFIYLLKVTGYTLEDIEEKIISPIRKQFDNSDFYNAQQHPLNKCPNQIENSIVKLHTYFGIDLGLKKIQEHYTTQLASDLSNSSYSSKTGDSIGWLIFLIENHTADDEFYANFLKEEIQNKLENQLSHMFKNESLLMFDNWKINAKNQLIEFLIRTKNIQIVSRVFTSLEYEKNSQYFLKMFIYLIKRNTLLEYHKNELSNLLDLFMDSPFKSLISSVKQLIVHCEDIDINELQSILITILDSKKDDI